MGPAHTYSEKKLRVCVCAPAQACRVEKTALLSLEGDVLIVVYSSLKKSLLKVCEKSSIVFSDSLITELTCAAEEK